MVQYVPRNWPVDDADRSKQVSKVDHVCLKNITLQATASQHLPGCFKARQMAYFGKNIGYEFMSCNQ